MKNNTIAAEMVALSACRRDGGPLFTVVCTRKDGTSWQSNTFPEAYAREFAATELANDHKGEYASVVVKPWN